VSIILIFTGVVNCFENTLVRFEEETVANERRSKKGHRLVKPNYKNLTVEYIIVPGALIYTERPIDIGVLDKLR